MSGKSKTDAMIAAKREEARRVQQQCHQAIEQLLRSSTPVTFASVASSAGVSTAYLYKNTELSERIRQIRTDQQRLRIQVACDRPETRGHTDASKDVLITAQAKRLKEYEKKIEQQAKEIDILRSKWITEL